MRLLDLFCCQGGAAMGYHRAGFEVTGVDLSPQPRFPFAFIQGDALEYLKEHGREYDAIAASPPCQAFSSMSHASKSSHRHQNLIPAVRVLSQALGKPYIIENVPAAPLENPVMLCGTMFPELKVYRHRLFESNVALTAPSHGKHMVRLPQTGRASNGSEWFSIAGHFSDVVGGGLAMGIDWMTQKGLAQAIPPAYTEYLGRQIMQHLEG